MSTYPLFLKFSALTSLVCKILLKSLNHILDASTPYSLFKSYVESYSSFIGIVKFGWGSSLVDPEFDLKKDLLDSLNIPCIPGGTLFEYFYHRNDIDTYINFVRQNRFQWIELSRGTVSIPDNEYHDLVNRLSHEFNVMSEIGFKSADRSDLMTDSDWLVACQQSLAAGAKLLVLEARESGSAGVVDKNGDIKSSMLNHLASVISIESILFEAPVKQLQVHFIKEFGSLVNLGNISLQNVLPVIALRQNLRSETLILSSST